MITGRGALQAAAAAFCSARLASAQDQPPFSTGKERDAETGLDFFESRYMSSPRGRFTSPDKFPWWSLQHSEKDEDKEKFANYIGNPHNWNMYAYVLNSPLNLGARARR